MIIDCKQIARKWKEECTGVHARLAIVQVGDNPASNAYIKGKIRDCEEVGFSFSLHRFPEDVTEEDLETCIARLNSDVNVNGIIVQLPLPAHLNADKIVNLVAIEKDVDGFRVGSPFTPCTPLGVSRLLDELEISVEGKLVVILGRSEYIGKKAFDLLLNKNATVAVCHSRTPLTLRDELLQKADVIISAVGKKDLFFADNIKDGAIVIDVGINKKDDGKLCGDFTPDANRNITYTSVPGGVGLLTRAMLLQNTLQAYNLQNPIE